MISPGKAARAASDSKWALVWLFVGLGLALRLAMGRGALWLDEAWSVVLVRQVKPFVGVLAQIHHDNNHPLNSWWIQLVGTHAPVLVLRSLSIVCSTLTIPIAARFAGRRSTTAGVAAAALFACSPMLMLIGSEARGYAAALLVQAWLIDALDPLRSAAKQEPAAWALILAGLLGTLAHLLFFPALLLIAAWQVAADDSERPLRQRLRSTVDRLAPALAASFAVIVLIVGSAYAVQGGLTVGNALPFTLGGWAAGVDDAIGMSLGASWLGLVLLPLLAFGPKPPRADATLWLVLGLGLPVLALVLRPPNAGIGRYYLPCVFALLSLAAIRCAVQRIGWLGWVAFAAIVAAMLWRDASLIGAQRSEPDLPVRILAAQGEVPPAMMLASSRLSAPIALAAERIRLPLRTSTGCIAADYLLADRDWGAAPKTAAIHCGAEWQLIASRPASYRDGAGWALYRRSGLQAPEPVANAPRRAAEGRAQARAGVAQG